MKVTNHIYELFIVKSETGKLLDMIDIRDLVDHLVIAGTDPVHALALLAGTFDTDDDLCSLFPFTHKFRDHIYRILKICTHTHNTVSICLFHSIDRRTCLSEILGVEDCFDLFIIGTQSTKQCLGVILGMVVDKQDLIIIFTEIAFHDFRHRFCKRHYIRLFIIGGNYH